MAIGTGARFVGLLIFCLVANAASAETPPAMLSAHNTYRSKHCVPALTWSAQLATAAQTWANGCKRDDKNPRLRHSDVPGKICSLGHRPFRQGRCGPVVQRDRQVQLRRPGLEQWSWSLYPSGLAQQHPDRLCRGIMFRADLLGVPLRTARQFSCQCRSARPECPRILRAPHRERATATGQPGQTL